jgi:hypothetical protein
MKSIETNFNFLNNRICPFCQGVLSAQSSDPSGPKYLKLYCPVNHIKVMYDGNTGYWRMFRIHDVVNERDLKCWNDGELHLEGSLFVLSNFDPFQYTFDELKDKLKLYLTFS